ncbi:hypothetical protein GJ654_18655 [Rhodoblastus acidophilus]|uniref:ParB-like N-terminal domain-containing protein n=1 Tax=Rhodoblastus acidophilus TaxID=1074 RepID=A0A6N8DVW1_RHOAC|nr:ParB/RepB/Spo0J family partition protein [Rhodoblastus acidophilus]MCW2276349.1 ParB family chromosome partitioning protein [Rhodoblastus acidophilus]MTV33004.1 hypothetical protein [Rhodoblastus acidophilus]
MVQLIAERKIAFTRINGASPCNVRAESDALGDDFASLAATIDALGQIKPLAVHGDDLSGYWIIDGLRRWNAQALRMQQGRLDPEADEIPAKIYEGTSAELAELSIAASLQKQLHPVEEFEAFAWLNEAGMTTEAIAKDFAFTLRHVKQRLALGRMATPIRTAWRVGKITRDQAEAYCEAGDPAEQQALFTRQFNQGEINAPAWQIRAFARKDKVSAADPMARYVGLDAYAKAGGVIRETLFDTDEEKLLTDGALLRRVAREKLSAEAEMIRAEEGWGFVVIEDDPEAPKFSFDQRALDLTDKERARLLEIEEESAQGDPEEEARVREVDAIEKKAFARTYSKTERKSLGITVEINDLGMLSVTRAAMLLPAQAAPEPASDSPREPAPQSDAYQPAPLERAKIEVEAPPSKGAGEVVNSAATEALAGVAAACGNFALALLVARLGCSYGGREGGLCISGHESAHCFQEPSNELLKSIKRENFGAALKIVADAPLNDITVAAFALIGAHINTRPEDFKHTRHTLRVAAEFSDVRARLREAMDYEAYFKACPREVAFDLFEEFLGASDVAAAKKLKKAPIVEKAAQLAKDKGWLPEQFSDLPVDADAEHPAPVAKPGRAASVEVATFVDAQCVRGDDIEQPTPAKEIYAAYAAFAKARGWTPITNAAFGQEIAALGVEKIKTRAGMAYVGLGLPAIPRPVTQAAE